VQTDKHAQIGDDLEAFETLAVLDFVDALEAAHAQHTGDDLLRLIFIACHPVLGAQARVALTLKLLGGLSNFEIARACMVPEPTIAQRIVRAKRTQAEARVPFRHSEARAGFERAAGMTHNEKEQDLLLDHAQICKT
jgi:predicted RNA polymerase sigma factor